MLPTQIISVYHFNKTSPWNMTLIELSSSILAFNSIEQYSIEKSLSFVLDPHLLSLLWRAADNNNNINRHFKIYT
jgi:hypothetical protein